MACWQRNQPCPIVALFGDDEALLNTFTGHLLANASAGVAVNAFPKLSAKGLLYKLSAQTKEASNKIQAVDAVLRQWHEKYPASKTSGMVVTLSAVQAMRDNGWEALGMLLSGAGVRSVVDAGPDRYP